MPSRIPEPPLALVRQALDDSPLKAVAFVEHQGHRYVAKRAHHTATRHLRSWWLSIGCALFFHQFVRPARLRAGGLDHEARRLREFKAQGVLVPDVVQETPEFLVLEYCGDNLKRVFKAQDAAGRRALLERFISELARFHRAGHWHGAAQIRNMTARDDLLYRIDFEEAAGDVLPLPLMQAYDVVLCLQSIVGYLDGDVAQGDTLIDRYFRLAPSSPVAAALRKVGRLSTPLLWLEPLAGPLIRRHRDVRRLVMLAHLLRHASRQSGKA